MQSYDMEHFKEAARDAEKSMRGVFERTPLQKNEHLSAIYGADIWLKREDLSPVPVSYTHLTLPTKVTV